MTENSKKDWLGGPQNGAEATYQQNGQTAVAPAELHHLWGHDPRARPL